MKLSTPHQWRIVDRHEAIDAGIDTAQLRPTEGGEQPAAYLDAQAWLEEDLGEGWVAAYRLTAQEGRPVVAEFRIFPNVWPAGRRWRPAGKWAGSYLGPRVEVPAGGLRATDIRRAAIGRALTRAKQGLARLQQLVPELFADEMPLAAVRNDKAQKGPARLEPLTLAEVAAEFHRGGLRAVQDRFGISKSTARGRVELARRRGMLPRVGKHGVRDPRLRRPTAAAKKVLSRARRKR